jgi:methionyl-tRNA synthetase
MTDSAPWKSTTSPMEAYMLYAVIMETLRVTGICLQPFMPGVSGRLLGSLGVPLEERSLNKAYVDLDDEMDLTLGTVQGRIRLFSCAKERTRRVHTCD